MRTPANEWKPIDGLELEPNALTVVKSTANTLVVAGPGAGKTELLAQRASYLLMTGACPAPRRVLAISFKRDAASNLRDRVHHRCGAELARRFDSYTYDAFAKGLLDRFLLALPEHLRVQPNYDVLTRNVSEQMEQLLGGIPAKAPYATAGDLRSLSGRDVQRIVEGETLPLTLTPTSGFRGYVRDEVWRLLLQQGSGGLLTFTMIQRAVELLLRANPALLRAVRSAYSHVFLDEFQDTTTAQYDLVSTVFGGSRCLLTAVGDEKQSIMGWAGAKTDAFDAYERDFTAERIPLYWNHRTAPRLTEILTSLVYRLDPKHQDPIESHYVGSADGVCEVWDFGDERSEASHVAERIAGLTQADGYSPRSICLVVRQRTRHYMTALVDALSDRGVKGRVEDQLQDLLTEPVWDALRSFLSVAAIDRTHGSHAECVRIVCESKHGGCEDQSSLRALRSIGRDVTAFARRLREDLVSATPDSKALEDRLVSIIDFIGQDFIRLAYPQYRQERYLREILAALSDGLWECFERCQSWATALADYEGVDSVPMMTIHKSKGLEYRTVFFIGLEDSAFWNFRNEAADEVRNFFVAFSRAREQVYFTFCHQRLNGPGYRNAGAQQRQEVVSLYQMLAEAGVKRRRFTDAEG